MKKLFLSFVLASTALTIPANAYFVPNSIAKNSCSTANAYYPYYVMITGNHVRLRTTPTTSTSKNIYTMVNNRTILRCVGVRGNWWQVVWGNRYLWVSKDFALAYNIQ